MNIKIPAYYVTRIVEVKSIIKIEDNIGTKGSVIYLKMDGTERYITTPLSKLQVENLIFTEQFKEKLK